MDPFIGQIQLLPYNSQLSGWLVCEGQTLQISQHKVLYSIIGNKFGSDNTLTFKLPDLSKASPLPGLRYYIAIQGIYLH